MVDEIDIGGRAEGLVAVQDRDQGGTAAFAVGFNPRAKALLDTLLIGFQTEFAGVLAVEVYFGRNELFAHSAGLAGIAAGGSGCCIFFLATGKQCIQYLPGDVKLNGLEMGGLVEHATVVYLGFAWPVNGERAVVVANGRLDENGGWVLVGVYLEALHPGECRP